MKKIFIIIAIVVTLLIVGAFLSSRPSGNATQDDFSSQSELTSELLEEGITVGKLARDFSLTTIEGDVTRLSDFRGKYVLFASMATWCTPCKIEAQNVRRAQDNFERIPLQVMQIGVDPRESSSDLARFRAEIGREDWIMGFDDSTISDLYNFRTFDATIVVDPEGKIVYRDDGFPIDTATLEALLESK